MTSFDDREKAFENKYAHDAEMMFKAAARGNRKLGHWAAERLGITGAEAADYAATVVAADLEEAGHEDVVRKITGDFQEKGVALDEAELRAAIVTFHAEAKAELMNEHG
ncbi:MAG: DUF1476 domain-containing protein [Pseudomonadota bacterium]